MSTNRPVERGTPGPDDRPGWFHAVSPVTGEEMGRARLYGARELAGFLADRRAKPLEVPPSEVFGFLARLRAGLTVQREALIHETLLETGFIASDCAEMVDGVIEFLRDFETYIGEKPRETRSVPHSYAMRGQREMRILQRPYHTVAALVPQNASLPLSITIIASALYAGSRLLLRPSLQCAASGERLAGLVEACDPPAGSIRIVNCLARDFLAASCDSSQVEMIHYIGSNRYALEVFHQAFNARKVCLLDGQGNGMLYLDDTFPTDDAIRLITSGATRYNGETCTSVNGVFVHERVYDEVRAGLVDAFRNLRVGHPAEADTNVGPLLSRGQAEDLAALLANGPRRRVLCGGTAAGAYFSPAIVEGVEPVDDLVQEGFFGPAIWMRSIGDESLFDWLRGNRFPLSDTILSGHSSRIRRFLVESHAARISVNEDPSVESMFEPWGGYPSSGYNIVSDWVDKYRQPFQLDGTSANVTGLAAEPHRAA